MTDAIKKFLNSSFEEQMSAMHAHGMRVQFSDEVVDGDEVTGNAQILFTQPIDDGLRNAMIGTFITRMEQEVEITAFRDTTQPQPN